MKRVLLSLALIFVAWSDLSATEALVFNEGGYEMLIFIGNTDKLVVGQVHFRYPGAKDRVVLGPEDLQIEKFDMHKHVLIMRFKNKNDPEMPPSFSFTAKKDKAVLSISGKQIKSGFNWEM